MIADKYISLASSHVNYHKEISPVFRLPGDAIFDWPMSEVKSITELVQGSKSIPDILAIFFFSSRLFWAQYSSAIARVFASIPLFTGFTAFS